MYRIVILILVAGCIQETLVPCGDLACPAGYECVASRCSTAAQLSACAGLSEDADCSIDHAAGKCEGGICTAVACGNGVVDPGEICDDGNQTSGDGCSGTCTSDETCGNGVVDVATGERCDCGTADHPSSLCTHPNSDDLAAECSSDCQARYCGDGVVDTIEQCDGAVPDGLTCASFGYYTGTLGCQSCQVSPAGCSGRCGDQVIDAQYGEFCDGTSPAGDSCVSFGWDNGALACSLACSANVGDCQVWGWNRAHTVTAAVTSLASGGAGVAVAYDNGEAYVLANGTWSKAPDSYQLVATSETAAWAIGSDHLAVWSGGTWSAMPPPWPAGTHLESAWASDALGLFVSHTTDAVLDRYQQGTWSQIADGGWGVAPLFQPTRSVVWVNNSTHAWTFDGTAWTLDISPAPFVAATEDDQHVIWASTATRVWTRSTSSSTWGGSVLLPAGYSLSWANGHLYTGNGLQFHAYGEPPVRTADLPRNANGSTPTIAAGPDGGVYVGASDGIYAFTRGEWSASKWDETSWVYTMHGGALTFGGAIYGGDTYAVDASDNVQDLGSLEYNCNPSTVTSAGRILAFCAGTTTLYDNSVAVMTGTPFDRVWSSTDNQQAAASGPNVFAWRIGGSWTKITTNTHLWELEGDSLSELYSVDATQGLMRFNGAQWTQLASDGRLPIAVTATRVYYDTAHGPMMYMRGNSSFATAPTPTGTYSIVAMGGEELFALAQSQPLGSPLWHFDGTTWTPVALPAAVPVADRLLADGHNLVVVAAGSLYELERVRLW